MSERGNWFVGAFWVVVASLLAAAFLIPSKLGNPQSAWVDSCKPTFVTKRSPEGYMCKVRLENGKVVEAFSPANASGAVQVREMVVLGKSSTYRVMETSRGS